jgi:hypothetical protein
MSCPFTQVPQASVVDETAETGKFPRYCELENHSFTDAGPSKGMYIELRAEGIS